MNLLGSRTPIGSFNPNPYGLTSNIGLNKKAGFPSMTNVYADQAHTQPTLSADTFSKALTSVG